MRVREEWPSPQLVEQLLQSLRSVSLPRVARPRQLLLSQMFDNRQGPCVKAPCPPRRTFMQYCFQLDHGMHHRRFVAEGPANQSTHSQSTGHVGRLQYLD